MREIGGDTGGVDDIVEREVVDVGRSLQKKGERLREKARSASANKAGTTAVLNDRSYLANATGGTCNDCLRRRVSECMDLFARNVPRTYRPSL